MGLFLDLVATIWVLVCVENRYNENLFVRFINHKMNHKWVLNQG